MMVQMDYSNDGAGNTGIKPKGSTTVGKTVGDAVKGVGENLQGKISNLVAGLNDAMPKKPITTTPTPAPTTTTAPADPINTGNNGIPLADPLAGTPYYASNPYDASGYDYDYGSDADLLAQLNGTTVTGGVDPNTNVAGGTSGSTGNADQAGSVDAPTSGDALDAGYEALLSAVINAAGSALGNMLPGVLGDMARSVFSTIADKLPALLSNGAGQKLLGSVGSMISGFGDKDASIGMAGSLLSNFSDMGKGLEGIRQQLSDLSLSGNFPSAADVGTEIATSDPGQFSEDLAKAAKEVDGMDLASAVREAASVDPLSTGKALEDFSESGLQWLRENGGLYTGGWEDLKKVNCAVATAYYESVMQAEANGLTLTEGEKKALEDLDMYGVDQSYSEFKKERKRDPSYKITMEADGVGIKSDGSMTRSSKLDPVKSEAKALVMSGDLADPYRDKTAATEMGRNMENRIALMRENFLPEDGKKMTSSAKGSLMQGYVDIAKEMQAYNDAAMQAIEEKYKDDPSGRYAAESGLAVRMQAQMGPLFEALYADGQELDLFKNNKAKLGQIDRLKITGVDVKASDYEPGQALMSSSRSYGDESLYADALSDTSKMGRAAEAFFSNGVAAATIDRLQPDAAVARERDSYKMALERLGNVGLPTNEKDKDYGYSK